MAVTDASYTGNGSTTNYSFTFPYLKASDVEVQVDATPTTAWSFANATTVQFNSAPSNGAKIKILRKTNVDNLTATFYAGSAIKSEDLNDNFTQNLYSTQEKSNRAFETTGGTITGDTHFGEDVKISFEGATDNAYETTLTVADPTADRTITLPNETGTVLTTGASGVVTSAMIADGTIAAADLASNSVTTAKITDANVTTAKLAADAVTGAKIADDSINSEHYVDGSIDTAHIADNQVTTAKIAADAITGAKIADDAIDSEHLAADSIDAEHYAPGSVDATALASNAVTQVKLADDAVGPDELASSAVVTASIVDNAVTLAKMADSSVGTSELVDSSVTAAKLATDAVTNAKVADNAIGTTEIADNAVTTGKIADAELTTLAGMQAGTASILAGGTALAATLTEINTVCDCKGVHTTISDSDAHYPTSGAVVDYVSTQLAAVGGFETIATDAAFPNTQPASGIIVSIADAGGLVVNGSGTSTTGRTVGGSTVTINNINSQFNSTTVAAGVAFMVESTGSGQIYNYHKATLKEADLINLSSDIDDFGNRYRVHNGEPSSNNDDGDLVWDTSANKMKVYNSTASAWEEVTSVGDYKLLGVKDNGQAHDGSGPTFNGSNDQYDLFDGSSDASITNAGQLIVSLNGVIQKPNASYDANGEGFALDGSDGIRFCDPPAAGSSLFVTQIGSGTSLQVPADNSVATAKIQNGAVTTAKLTDANVTTAKIAGDAITGAKIADDAIDSEHYTDGSIDSAHIADDAVTAAKIADASIDEVRLNISNSPTNGQFLSAQSGNTGGLTWADGASEGTSVKSTGESGGTKFLREDGDGTCSWQTVSAGTALTGSTNNQVTTVTGANAITGEANLTFDGSNLTVNSTVTTKTLNLDGTVESSPSQGDIWYNNGTYYFGSNIASAWASGGNLSTGRYAHAACGIQSAGLVAGGWSGGSSNSGGGGTTVTEEYDATSWSGGGTLPAICTTSDAMCGTQTAALYASQQSNSAVNTVEYDGSSWSTGGNTNSNHHYGSAFGLQTAGVLSGGAPGGTNTNVTEEYDGSSWSSGGNLNNSKKHHGSAGTLTVGLAAGGNDGAAEDDTEEYDGTSWSTGNDMNQVYTAHAVAGTQSNAFAAGGTSDTDASSTYDGTTWTAAANMTTAHPNTAGGGLTTAGWVAGGSGTQNATSEFNYSTTVQTSGYGGLS